MTQQEPPAAPATESPPASPTIEERIAALEAKGVTPEPPVEDADDEDDDNLLDDMIESIEEIPMFLFRPIRDLFRRDR